MNIPKSVKITKEEGEALQELNRKQNALQQFIQMVTQQGEMQIQRIMKDGQTIWQTLAGKYGIDLENVVWDYDEKSGEIRPTRMNIR